ncbi:hypothetical protein Tco_0594685 [Tanacetum coccineum]
MFRPEMEGMVDQLKSKVIDTLTTTLESVPKHAEVVEAEVVNCETNLVECPLVEKDVIVLRVVIDSCDMNLVDCPVVHKENSEPKRFTFIDTQPSTMEHLVNACAFVSPPFPFYDSPKADKCVEPAQDTNDTDDDYMDFENDPSQNGELTISLYEEPQKETAKCSEDGNMNLDKLIADVTKFENKSQRPTTPQVKKKRKRFNNLNPIEFSLTALSEHDCSQQTLQPFKEQPYEGYSPDVYEILFKEWCSTKATDKFPWVNYGIVVDEH